MGPWKMHFSTREDYYDTLQGRTAPLVFNLRSDPFEQADQNSIYYHNWLIRRVFLLVPAQGFVANWIQSFREFPPSQKPASFSIDQVMEKLTAAGQQNH